MRILFVGDIFGKPGREIARRAIPALIERESLDYVIEAGVDAPQHLLYPTDAQIARMKQIEKICVICD